MVIASIPPRRIRHFARAPRGARTINGGALEHWLALPPAGEPAAPADEPAATWLEADVARLVRLGASRRAAVAAATGMQAARRPAAQVAALAGELEQAEL